DISVSSEAYDRPQAVCTHSSAQIRSERARDCHEKIQRTRLPPHGRFLAHCSGDRRKAFFISVASPAAPIDIGGQRWIEELRKGMAGSKTQEGFHAEIGIDEPWTLEAHRLDIKDAERRIGRYA